MNTYSGELLKINGKTIKKIIKYQVGYMKLWGKDTGRAMTGDNNGTLIGIFPKLSIQIGKMSDDEMSEFLKIVNKASAIVEYYDTELQKTVKMSFYFGDAIDELKRKSHMTHNPIEISIISNKSRERGMIND